MLAMLSRLMSKFRRITGFSTPFVGVSWAPSETNAPVIVSFCDTICLTSPDNEEFVSFLESNAQKIVFMNAWIDASVATERQFKIFERELASIDLNAINGVPLPLPRNDGCNVLLAFYFIDDRALKSSHGGTGVNMLFVSGFFEISQTIHGGPTLAYHLKEINAPLETRIRMLDRQES